MPPARTILHVDMDAFFASVEQRDHPHLRGQPVLVGYEGPRGVVAAASYEARRFGCRSAMPMSIAKRLCPHAKIVPVRGPVYRAVSRRIFAILDRFAPVVEPLSIDEAFLDATGTEGLYRGDADFARTLGHQIKAAIYHDTALTASVGIAENKFLAKLASDLDKPDGLSVLVGPAVEALLPGLPASSIFGIGPKTAARLADVGIRTIADLRRMNPEQMAARLGPGGAQLGRLAWGIDERPVMPDRGAKSISHEETFETDLGDPAQLRPILLRQMESVAERLRRHDLLARRVHLKIRYGDFITISRSCSLTEPSNATEILWNAARTTFDTWAHDNFRPVRLLGVGAENLGPPAAQLSLFAAPDNDRRARLDRAIDQINQHFHPGVIRRAGTE